MTVIEPIKTAEQEEVGVTTWQEDWQRKKIEITLEKEVKHHILTYSAVSLRTRVKLWFLRKKIYTFNERYVIIMDALRKVLDGETKTTGGLRVPGDLSGEDLAFILTKMYAKQKRGC
jgi:hypothetical protein